jgi:hypothetical protein
MDALSVTVQVFMMQTPTVAGSISPAAASISEANSVNPFRLNAAARFSDSDWLTLHPSVLITNRRQDVMM